MKKMAEANFPTIWGKFRIYGFEGHFEGIGERRKESAVALVMGDVLSTPPLVRIHSQCLTGDVFGSLRCDCRQQLEMALALIAEAGGRHPRIRRAGRSRHWPDAKAASLRVARSGSRHG